MNYKPFTINLANMQRASAILVQEEHDIAAALTKLGLETRPTLVLVGGAARLDQARNAEIYRVFHDGLAPLAQALDANVVDGGTDSGVIQMMGKARAAIGATFPLIGVAAVGTVSLPMFASSNQDAWVLEPHHSHFILVPGNQWGDESKWIARIASQLALSKPSVTILINGGKVTWMDAAHSVTEGRPVLVVAGSGRTADELARALYGERCDESAKKLVQTGLVTVTNLDGGSEGVRAAIETHLVAQRKPAELLYDSA